MAATCILAYFTYTLSHATNRYRIATEKMAETQEKASAIQEKVLEVDRANLIMRIFNLISPGVIPGEALKNKFFDWRAIIEKDKEAEQEAYETFLELCRKIFKDIKAEQQD